MKTWLLTLTRHAAFRRHRRAPEPLDDTPLDQLGVAAGWGDPEAAVALKLDAQRLRATLAQLPAEAQEVIVLRDLEGIAGDEVAELLGVSRAAMKSRLHRARLQLAAAVRRAFRHGA